MIRLKDLRQKYIVSRHFSDPTQYGVYSNIPKGRSAQPYLCSIKLTRKGVILNDIHYTNVTELIKAIESYVESLPFESDNYSPDYRKGIFEDFGFIDTFEKLLSGDGFEKREALRFHAGFEEHVLTPKVEYDFDKKRVWVILNNGGMRGAPASTLEEAIEFANQHYWLMSMVGFLSLGEKLTQMTPPEGLVDTKVAFLDKNTGEVTTKEFREDLIAQAEDLIRRLKQ